MKVRFDEEINSSIVVKQLTSYPFVYHAESLKYMYSITKPKVVFCDGQDYEKVRAATKDWQPEIITASESVPGVLGIETLLEETKTEQFYQ